MKKKVGTKTMAGLCAVLMAVTVAACGNNAGGSGTSGSGASGTDTTAADASTAETSAAETGDSAGTEASAEPLITVTSHMEEDAYMEGIQAEEYVELAEYKALEVTVPKVEVTEEEIDERVDGYASQLPGAEVTDRDVAQDGDTLIVDYEGRYKDTEEVFQPFAENQSVTIGGTGYIEGFDTGMIGHKKGETFDMEVTFPEDYHNEDLQGKDAIFTVTIHSITLPQELTEDTVAELGITDVTTMQQLRDYAEEQIVSQKEASNESQIENLVLDKLLEESRELQEPPAAMVSRYRDLVYANVEQMAAEYRMYGMEVSVEEIITESMTAEGFTGTPVEYLETIAADQCKMLIALTAIAEKEGLQPTEEEVKQNVADTISQGGFASVEEYDEASGLKIENAIRENLVVQKAIAYLVENAKVTEE